MSTEFISLWFQTAGYYLFDFPTVAEKGDMEHKEQGSLWLG